LTARQGQPTLALASAHLSEVSPHDGRRAPTFVRRSEQSPNQPTIRVGDLTIGEMSILLKAAAAGADLHRRTVAKHPHNPVASARGLRRRDPPRGHAA